MSNYLTRLVARMTPDLLVDTAAATTVEAGRQVMPDAGRAGNPEVDFDPFEAALEEDEALLALPTESASLRPQDDPISVPVENEPLLSTTPQRIEPSFEADETNVTETAVPRASLPVSHQETRVSPRVFDDEPRDHKPEVDRQETQVKPPPAVPLETLPVPDAPADSEAQESAAELADSLARMDQFMSQFTAARNVLDRLQARADEPPDVEDHLTADMDDSALPFAPVVRTLEPLVPAEDAGPARLPFDDDVPSPRAAVSIGEIRVEVGRDLPNPPVRRTSTPAPSAPAPARPPSKRRFGIGQM